MLQFTRKVFVKEKKELLKRCDTGCASLHWENHHKNMVIFGTKSQPKNSDPHFGVQIWPVNEKMEVEMAMYALRVSSHFWMFLSFIAMEISTMTRFTLEGEAEVMCKTGVQSAPLLQETGRASASLTSLLLSSLLATSGLEMLHHSWLFQRDFSQTNLVSSLPLETEVASPSIPNLALTHAFPASRPRFCICLSIIVPFPCGQALSTLWHHQLDTKSRLTFYLLATHSAFRTSILSTWNHFVSLAYFLGKQKKAFPGQRRAKAAGQ